MAAPPRDCIALAEALLYCNVKSGLDVIQIPKSFSDDITLSLEIDHHSYTGSIHKVKHLFSS